MYVISTVLPQWHNWLINCSIVKLNIWHHVPEQTSKSWNKNINRESLIHQHKKTPEYQMVFNTHGQSAFQVSEGFPFSHNIAEAPLLILKHDSPFNQKPLEWFQKPLWVCGCVVSLLTYVLSQQRQMKYIPKSVQKNLNAKFQTVWTEVSFTVTSVRTGLYIVIKIMQIKELYSSAEEHQIRSVKLPTNQEAVNRACVARGMRQGKFGERKTRKLTLDQSACIYSEQKCSLSGQHVGTSAPHLQVLFKEPRFIVKAVLVHVSHWFLPQVGEKNNCVWDKKPATLQKWKKLLYIRQCRKKIK